MIYWGFSQFRKEAVKILLAQSHFWCSPSAITEMHRYPSTVSRQSRRPSHILMPSRNSNSNSEKPSHISKEVIFAEWSREGQRRDIYLPNASFKMVSILGRTGRPCSLGEWRNWLRTLRHNRCWYMYLYVCGLAMDQLGGEDDCVRFYLVVEEFSECRVQKRSANLITYFNFSFSLQF